MSARDQDRSQQRYILFALPLCSRPFIATQPAGLGLYWIATNVWSLGQQCRRAAVHAAAGPADPEEIAAKAAKPPPPPPRKQRSGK